MVERKQAEMQSKKAAAAAANSDTHHGNGNTGNTKSNFLKSFAENRSSPYHRQHRSLHDMSTKPVAELFLEATICFADIVGFTAWYVCECVRVRTRPFWG
jgi:hypothetical protein